MPDRDPATPAYGWPTPDYSDPAWLTANGVHIVDGLRVWDYDGKAGSVDFTKTFGEHFEPGTSYWGGWFDVLVDEGGYSLMDGSRLTTRHPYTGSPPPAKPDDTEPAPGA